MTGKRRLILWTGSIGLALAISAGIIASRPHTRPIALGGAVIRQDADPKKQLPIADVQVAAVSNGAVIGNGKSDASGFFSIVLRTGSGWAPSVIAIPSCGL